MIFDKKRSVSMILSKMDKDGKVTETDVAQESGPQDAYTAFAEDLMSAIKDGSVQRAASVLRSYHEMIMDEDEIQDAKE